MVETTKINLVSYWFKQSLACSTKPQKDISYKDTHGDNNNYDSTVNIFETMVYGYIRIEINDKLETFIPYEIQYHL